MSPQLKSLLTANMVFILILIQVSCWTQEVDAVFMMSHFHIPTRRLISPLQPLPRTMLELEIPIPEQDRQRLKLMDAHKTEERLNKVRRASKGSGCVPGKGATADGKPGVECFVEPASSYNTYKALPVDDVKRMILRVEELLDNLIVKGYMD